MGKGRESAGGLHAVNKAGGWHSVRRVGKALCGVQKQGCLGSTWCCFGRVLEGLRANWRLCPAMI